MLNHHQRKRTRLETLRRLRSVTRGFGIALRAFARTLLGETPEAALARFKALPRDRQQWRRWYQVNHKHQMRLRGLRQRTGCFIDAVRTSLPRWVVQAIAPAGRTWGRRSKAFAGPVTIGQFSGLRKLMRAARRGKLHGEHLGTIASAVESAKARATLYMSAYQRRAEART